MKNTAFAKTELKTYVIDAAGKVLGRVATLATDNLRGKLDPSFVPHMESNTKVVVLNAAQIVLTGNKMTDKRYHHHTGYSGGLKTTTAQEVYAKDPSDLIRRAVYGMLPKNKLRDRSMKRITILNGNNYSAKATDILVS